MPFAKWGGGRLRRAAVAVPQGAGMQATQTGADREADASSLGLGKSVSACASAHMHTIFPPPLPSHSELPSFPRCPRARRSALPLLFRQSCFSFRDFSSNSYFSSFQWRGSKSHLAVLTWFFFFLGRKG